MVSCRPCGHEKPATLISAKKREWLDREMMPSALSVFLTHFPEFRGTEIAERSGPMTVAGFRSYPDFPDPLGAIDPNAVQARISRTLF